MEISGIKLKTSQALTDIEYVNNIKFAYLFNLQIWSLYLDHLSLPQELFLECQSYNKVFFHYHKVADK